MNDNLNDAYAIAKYIKEAKKVTPCKLFINGDFADIKFDNVQSFGSSNSKIIFGDIVDINNILTVYKERITDYVIENDRRNSAIPLLDYTKVDARIEPGSSIRDFVKIGKNVVVMMGAIINIGAEIGDKTMIDMNTVIGARAIIGRNCHIGAGSVVAGVLEPPSKQPVIIEDDVFVGANVVILEGVRIGRGSVVAAGSVVTTDVLENMVVAGAPAKAIKTKDDETNAKTILLEDLRK